MGVMKRLYEARGRHAVQTYEDAIVECLRRYHGITTTWPAIPREAREAMSRPNRAENAGIAAERIAAWLKAAEAKPEPEPEAEAVPAGFLF